MKLRILILALDIVLVPRLARADVKPHALCTEGMILQQKAAAKIWGTADKWIDAEPATVGNFTAVGYFFGRQLQEKLQVPVGLIHTSWGGTRIEAWMSTGALAAAGVKEPEPKKLGANTASALYNGMIHP